MFFDIHTSKCQKEKQSKICFNENHTFTSVSYLTPIMMRVPSYTFHIERKCTFWSTFEIVNKSACNLDSLRVIAWNLWKQIFRAPLEKIKMKNPFSTFSSSSCRMKVLDMLICEMIKFASENVTLVLGWFMAISWNLEEILHWRGEKNHQQLFIVTYHQQ